MESSRDLYRRVRAGEVPTAELRERLYTATLYVLAFAFVLSQATARAVVRYTPAVLTTLKKLFATLSDAIPETGEPEPNQ